MTATAPVSGSGVNPGASSPFFSAVLSAIGAPVTPTNVAFLNAWARREGGGGANNPLNSTLPYGASTRLAGNSAGVQNYASWSDGVNATAATLLNGNYNDVVSALRSDTASTSGVYSGLATWSGGGYNSLAGVSGAPYTISGGSLGPGNPATAMPGGPRAGAGGSVAGGDWLQALDSLLNPDAPGVVKSLTSVGTADIGYVLRLLGIRGGFATLGVILAGAGLLVAFGPNIFGGALLAVPGVGETAGAAEALGVATRTAIANRGASRKAAGAAAARRATGGTSSGAGRHAAERSAA